MAGNKNSARKNAAQVEMQCKTEGCKNEAVLMDACADCFNAEYDKKHRRDEPQEERNPTKHADGSDRICTFCDKNRPVVSKGHCRPCYNKEDRKIGRK